MEKVNEGFGRAHHADASTDVHCQAVEHSPRYAMCCLQWSAKECKLRPRSSPPATISEWIFARKGAFAMMLKGLHGGALLVFAAQCCNEHRHKKLVLLRTRSVLSNYIHASNYQNTLHFKLKLAHP